MFAAILLGPPGGRRSPQGFPSIAISLGLTLISLTVFPVQASSAHPAPRMEQPFLAGGWPIEALWLFRVAPIAFLAGLTYPALACEPATKRSLTDQACSHDAIKRNIQVSLYSRIQGLTSPGQEKLSAPDPISYM